MNDSSLSTLITDVQRDRAVEYLQRAYAAGALSEGLFEERLGQALTAQTRGELNASLRGIARVAPAMLSGPPAASNRATEGIQNLAAGLFHLATLPTAFLAPALGRALAPAGGRASLEASRAMCFQFNALIYGSVAVLLVVCQVASPLLLLFGFVAWGLLTLWLAIRAFTGQKSTALVERLMLVRPQEDRLARMR
ncbi:MAG: DUF1707 domain-containing protein [Propionibacteriaceae bacterium]|nr:DUF1707 domain-containing protein [Propionibacteriaceae bacterium]